MSACVCARKLMTRLVFMVGWVDGCGVGRTLDLCVCVCVCVCVLVRAGAHVNRNSDLVVCDFGFVGGGGWVWMVVGGCAGISGTDQDLCV